MQAVETTAKSSLDHNHGFLGMKTMVWISAFVFRHFPHITNYLHFLLIFCLFWVITHERHLYFRKSRRVSSLINVFFPLEHVNLSVFLEQDYMPYIADKCVQGLRKVQHFSAFVLLQMYQYVHVCQLTFMFLPRFMHVYVKHVGVCLRTSVFKPDISVYPCISVSLCGCMNAQEEKLAQIFLFTLLFCFLSVSLWWYLHVFKVYRCV